MPDEKNIRVLIVDDQPAKRLMIKEVLSGLNLTLLEAESGKEALRILLQMEVAVILMDVVMPQMNGYETAKLIRARPSSQQTPILFITASDPTELGAQTGYLVGGVDFIFHPVIPGVLRSKVLAFCDFYRHKARIVEQAAQLTAQNKTLQDQLDESKRLRHDPLTGLPNRYHLEELLGQTIAKEPESPFCLLLLNLDRFREINDTLGFLYGDLLIKRVAVRVQDRVAGQSCTVARLDGNTFAIVLLKGDLRAAMQEAQKIISVLTSPFSLNGMEVHVEGCIGIAIYSDHGRDAHALIQRADVAVQLAKGAGKSIEVYSKEKDRHSPRRLALIAGLPRAMEENQLFLEYQPKLDIQTGRCVGVEALLRWNHPEYGLILPNEFVRSAEQTGLIQSLTVWVLQEAFKQYCVWNPNRDKIGMAVNLSARNLHDPHLTSALSTLLSVSGIDPHLIKLEIVESTMMIDSESVRETLAQIGKMGLSLSIDDFGTGYSSLSYLKRLPVSEIKIDQSFVADMMTDETEAQIVHAVIQLAHDLVIAVVAEGVEDQATWDALRALGCDIAQGYYISRSLSAEALAHWLANLQKGGQNGVTGSGPSVKGKALD